MAPKISLLIQFQCCAGLPLMMLAGFGVRWGFENKRWKPNPVFGPYLRYAGAMGAAFVMGKLLYMPRCVEKLKALDSPLGRRLRNRGPLSYSDENLEFHERQAYTEPARGPSAPAPRDFDRAPSNDFQVNDTFEGLCS